jgi:hypothetical protein
LTRGRFFRDRRKLYLNRIEGKPSDAQIAMAQSMARLEWFALVAERDSDTMSIRESRENRRLLLRTIFYFDLSLKEQEAPVRSGARKPRPGPPQLSLEEHLELLRQGGAR